MLARHFHVEVGEQVSFRSSLFALVEQVQLGSGMSESVSSDSRQLQFLAVLLDSVVVPPVRVGISPPSGETTTKPSAFTRFTSVQQLHQLQRNRVGVRPFPVGNPESRWSYGYRPGGW